MQDLVEEAREQNERTIKRNNNLNLIIMAVIFIGFILYSLIGKGKGAGAGLRFIDDGLVITDSEGKETVITYAEMESITFVEQADYGEPVDGLTTGVFAKHMEGTFRSEMFGEYTVCGDPKIVCAIRIQTAENVYVINMESDESTARLYEAMIERVKSE